jgi:hypothetical protein
MPHVPGSEHLLSIFFEFGPAKKDGPVEVGDVLDWGIALGIEWKPWHTRLFVRLSRDYCVAQFEATKFYAPPPWPGIAKVWDYVRAKETGRRAEEMLKQRVPKAER